MISKLTNIGKSFSLKTMTSIDKKFFEIRYSLFEIMLFISIWTYGLFGAFISRSENLFLLTLSSLLVLVISYVFVILDHQNKKKIIKIRFKDIKNTVIIFFLMCFLINDGLFSWFYNDQSAHISEAFKHGIFAAKLFPEINEFPYKTFIYIVNVFIIIFFIIFFKILRNLKKINSKIIFFTIIFLSLRIGIILSGGTESIHPPFRLFPIFLSGTIFGLNELGIRFIQLILVSSFLSYLFKKVSSQISINNSLLFLGVIISTPLLLFTSMTIEPSIYAFLVIFLFLMDLNNLNNFDDFNFFKWIFIISIGSLIRQPVFLLFIPLFVIFLLKKNKLIKNPIYFASPLLLSLPIFFYSIIRGTPSTKTMSGNNFLNNNYFDILLNVFNEFLIFFLIICFIPHNKYIRSNILTLFTFLILFTAFILVPFYGYEFTYRYHAEYALPFIFLGIFKTIQFFENNSYRHFISLILLLTILLNFTKVNQIFFQPKEINFNTLLSNNLSENSNVYEYLKNEQVNNNFYYLGVNQRLISKIIYGLSIKSSINSTKTEHNNIETFGTNLSYDEIDIIIDEYDMIIIDIFDINTPSEVNDYSVSNDIKKHNKIVNYLNSKNLIIKKQFFGRMNFKTIIFVNE
mgnify:CR=1 FL=1